MSPPRAGPHLTTGALFELAAERGDRAKRERSETHVDRCPGCRHEALFLKSALTSLRLRPVPPAPDQRVDQWIGSLLAEVAPKRRARQHGGRPFALLLFAALATVLVAWLFPWYGDSKINPPTHQTRDRALAFEPSTRRALFELEVGAVAEAFGAPLELRIGRSMQVELAPSARVELVRCTEGEKRIAVEGGRVRVLVKGRAPHEVIAVQTPSGVIQVTGTIFTVDVGDRTTQVSVEEGRVEMTALGVAHSVASGERMSLPVAQYETLPASEARKSATSREPGGEAVREILSSRGTRPVLVEKRRSARPEPVVLGGIAEGQKRAWYEEAESALERGDPQAAEAALVRLIIEEGNTSTAEIARFELARIRDRQLGDRPGALKAYRKFLLYSKRPDLSAAARRAICRLDPSDLECSP